jgi:hypothetical protein
VGWVFSTDGFQIPFIQRAKNLSEGKLELFASAWAAPKWMKTNGQYAGFGFLHENMYQAWADYYVKFLDSYQEQGIEFWGLTTGNEPSLGMIPFFKISSVGWLPKMMVLQCVPFSVLLNLRLLGDLDSIQFGPHHQKLQPFGDQNHYVRRPKILFAVVCQHRNQVQVVLEVPNGSPSIISGFQTQNHTRLRRRNRRPLVLRHYIFTEFAQKDPREFPRKICSSN